jgi:hypothetical protein
MKYEKQFHHGHAKRINGKVIVSRLYRCWQNMMSRCNNSKVKAFKNYGMRGIKVCESWKESRAFIQWAMANGYQDDLTIDRIDNDGNYEPSNCRWVTFLFNRKHRRKKCAPAS